MSTVQEIKRAMRKLPLGKRLELVKQKPSPPKAGSTTFHRVDLKNDGQVSAGL